MSNICIDLDKLSIMQIESRNLADTLDTLRNNRKVWVAANIENVIDEIEIVFNDDEIEDTFTDFGFEFKPGVDDDICVYILYPYGNDWTPYAVIKPNRDMPVTYISWIQWMDVKDKFE